MACRGRALALVALLLAPALTGCLVDRIPGLFETPTRPPPPGEGRGRDVVGGVQQIRNVTWDRNDTWVWESTGGARLTDRVLEVRRISRQVGASTIVATRYVVESREEFASALQPVVTRHTYEGTTLGVVESDAPAERVEYTLDGNEWRNNPLLYVVGLLYNTTFNLTRWGEREVFTRSTNYSGLGRETVATPAGTFQAWHVRLNASTARLGLGPSRETHDRWFNESVKNDVRFQRSGTSFNLVAYRIGNDTRPLALAQLRPPDVFWDVGWGWHYRGMNGTTTILRDVSRCSSLFDLCVGDGLVYGNESWDKAARYWAYRTRIDYSVGERVLRESEIALVPLADNPAPRVVDYFRFTAPETFEYELVYAPAGPTVVPKAGTVAFEMTGRGSDGFPRDHRVTATTVLLGKETVDTPLGPIEGTRARTTLAYTPKDASGGAASGTQVLERVWSDALRNDVLFEIPGGSGNLVFVLDGFHFGDARKWERDI